MSVAAIVCLIFGAAFAIGLFAGQLVAFPLFERNRATNPRLYWLIQYAYAFAAVLSGAMALRLL